MATATAAPGGSTTRAAAAPAAAAVAAAAAAAAAAEVQVDPRQCANCGHLHRPDPLSFQPAAVAARWGAFVPVPTRREREISVRDASRMARMAVSHATELCVWEATGMPRQPVGAWEWGCWHQGRSSKEMPLWARSDDGDVTAKESIATDSRPCILCGVYVRLSHQASHFSQCFDSFQVEAVPPPPQHVAQRRMHNRATEDQGSLVGEHLADRVPTAIFWSIMLYCDTNTLGRLACVSRGWQRTSAVGLQQRLAQHDTEWQQLLPLRFATSSQLMQRLTRPNACNLAQEESITQKYGRRAKQTEFLFVTRCCAISIKTCFDARKTIHCRVNKVGNSIWFGDARETRDTSSVPYSRCDCETALLLTEDETDNPSDHCRAAKQLLHSASGRPGHLAEMAVRVKPGPVAEVVTTKLSKASCCRYDAANGLLANLLVGDLLQYYVQMEGTPVNQICLVERTSNRRWNDPDMPVVGYLPSVKRIHEIPTIELEMTLIESMSNTLKMWHAGCRYRKLRVLQPCLCGPYHGQYDEDGHYWLNPTEVRRQLSIAPRHRADSVWWGEPPLWLQRALQERWAM